MPVPISKVSKVIYTLPCGQKLEVEKHCLEGGSLKNYVKEFQIIKQNLSN